MTSAVTIPRQLAPTVGPAATAAGSFRTGPYIDSGERVADYSSTTSFCARAEAMTTAPGTGPGAQQRHQGPPLAETAWGAGADILADAAADLAVRRHHLLQQSDEGRAARRQLGRILREYDAAHDFTPAGNLLHRVSQARHRGGDLIGELERGAEPTARLSVARPTYDSPIQNMRAAEATAAELPHLQGGELLQQINHVAGLLAFLHQLQEDHGSAAPGSCDSLARRPATSVGRAARQSSPRPSWGMRDSPRLNYYDDTYDPDCPAYRLMPFGRTPAGDGYGKRKDGQPDARYGFVRVAAIEEDPSAAGGSRRRKKRGPRYTFEQMLDQPCQFHSVDGPAAHTTRQCSWTQRMSNGDALPPPPPTPPAGGYGPRGGRGNGYEQLHQQQDNHEE